MSDIIDFTELGKIATKEAGDKKGRVHRRAFKIIDSVGGRLQLNENDLTIEAIEVLLGIKPGGTEKVIEVLGLTIASDSPEEDEVKNKGFLRAYEHDGTFLGTGFKSEEDAVAAGFQLWLEADGTVKGVRKPAPPAIVAGPADDNVTVVDKKGNTKRQIPRDEYEAHTANYLVVEVDADTHKPVKVREARVLGR